MKLILNLYFFLFILLVFNNKSLSLSDYEIREICKKEKKRSNCIKNLYEKRLNLRKGEIIEIPVLPYKR